MQLLDIARWGMMEKNKIEKEIEWLKHDLSELNFEQNHILNDWLPRIIFIATLDITLFLALFNLGYYFTAFLIIAIGMLEMGRRSADLNKERNKIVHRRALVSFEIFKRYKILGVDAPRIE